jgi:hypothetical protein
MHTEPCQASEKSPDTMDPTLQKLLDRIAALEHSHQQLRNQQHQQKNAPWTDNPGLVFFAMLVVFSIFVPAMVFYGDTVIHARNEAWMREFGVAGYIALRRA